MNEQLLADFLDDRNRLNDQQFAELLSALRADVTLAQTLRQSLMMDELLSRTLGSSRGNFVAQVAMRIHDIGEPPSGRHQAIREKIFGKEARPAQDEVVLTVRRRWWTNRSGWALAAAATLAIVAGGVWVGLRPSGALGLRVAEVAGTATIENGRLEMEDWKIGRLEGGKTVEGENIHHAPSTIHPPSGTRAVVGMELKQGDRVVVKDGGKVGLKYDGEATTIDLQAVTEAVFAAEKGAKRVTLLAAGKLVCVAAPQKLPFRIQTPHAVAEIVGTRFSLDVTSAMTTLAVQEGEVALIQGENRLDVSAGRTATASEIGLALEIETPVRGIVLGEEKVGQAMLLRLWWNPVNMVLEGEKSAIHGGATRLFRWKLTGPTDTPVNSLGNVNVGNAKRLIRLANGRLLGLDAPWVSSESLPECAPVQLQPKARRLGPAVPLDATSISMAACDQQGQYFMAALKKSAAQTNGARVVIWDLPRGVLAADLTNLPTTPHKMGDFGFMACAVVPDAALGVVVDSGGGLLVLDLPAGTIRHRLRLPMSRGPQDYGADLTWEDGALICRGWPSLVETIRVDPAAGVILERLDHPVIRHGGMTMHVRTNELEVVRPGTAVQRIPLPQLQVGPRQLSVMSVTAGWRCSPDGRWLAGTPMTGTEQVLVDLREGRCLSPQPEANKQRASGRSIR